MHDNFQRIIYDFDDLIGKKVRQRLVLGLRKAVFPERFGGKFPVALVFIVDALLKRGNAFKSIIKATDIIALVSYVAERDVFLSHYKYALFWRLASRSTIGLSDEIKFADSIAGVVQEENLTSIRELLEQGKEQIEPSVSKFSYLTLRFSLAPERLSESYVNRPSEYESSKSAVQAILKRKFPMKSFKWIDSVGTAELKLRTSSGFSVITASLGQVEIMSLLCAEPASFSKILSLIRDRNEEYAKRLLKPICDCKMVIAEGLSADGDWFQAKFSMNHTFIQKKAVIADNWSPKQLKIKELSQVRFNAVVACMVRIMKGSRMMRTRQLIEQTVKETSLLFPVTMEDIGNCLQHLTSQRYLEASGEDYLVYLE
jgi:hypothetical protein